ncbi:MAG TPA: hypothetical protein VER33_22130 [Polyangiaceae bacterium]|nr:hypothetical protein [Polyangiaceae bacterium]
MGARFGRRRYVPWVLLAMLALGAFLLWGPSDERRILAALHELAAACSEQPGDTPNGRRARVLAGLGRNTTAELVVVAPEVGVIEGREAVAEWLALAQGFIARIQVEQASVSIADEQHARANLVGTLIFRSSIEERRDTRSAQAELVRHDGQWRVVRLDIGSRPPESPEARP